ncbi:HAMP domain-containing sensor histidine kinase [Mitsuaria sp. 7]|uniref:sensor histidine kinase n=1 Tax=Mitsuaria sp. 7 TaxID=1658665 RepID=UPI0007DD484D|nr:HAMP domain-containing sensor histidine kinase [Mitsuaria sp. 7]ANH67279.1 hypothetical protein ABE85_06315 [Mitsuaria sp. 7]
MQVLLKALQGKGARIAAVVLALLVAAFGVLQYQWMAKVGELDKERQMRSLKTSLTSFAEDFDGELSELQLRFQLNAASAFQAGADGLAGHYDAWRRQARFPALIQEIWVVVASDNGGPAIAAAPGKRSWTARRFDPATKRLMTEDLPKHLTPLLDEAAVSLGIFPTTTTATGPSSTVAWREPTWLDEQSLTLIAPMFNASTPTRPSDQDEPTAVAAGGPQGFAFIVLDRSRILNTVLPALAMKHFQIGTSGSRDAGDYDIAVRKNTPAGDIVFSTFSNVEEEQHAPDASVPLLQLEPPTFAFQPVMIAGVAAASATAPAASSQRMPPAINIVRAGVATPALPLGSEPPAAPWRLTALHRSGSLASFVDATWRRNLMISAGVLLLLLTAASAALLAWQRSADLRRQQLEFVAGISHELRTPVSVVCMSGANLADGVVSQPSQVQQYGQVILREGRRLAEMTEQVLAFARIDSNESPQRLPFPLAQVVHAALDAHEALIREWKFSCVVIGDEATNRVMGDAHAVERAVQNLLSNALKYSDAVRQITVSVLTRDDASGSWVGVSVEDRGIGIPAAELDQMFQPFKRGRQAIERNIPGTGIGLSLVKRVAESHGGSVEIRSRADQGTVVTMWLPEYVGDQA